MAAPSSGSDAHHALLDAVFAHAPIGLAFWDTDLRYRRINEALAEINGVAPDEHLGRTPSDVLGSLGGVLERILAGVLETGEAVRDRVVVGETPARPGTIRRWLTTYYPVTGSDGETLGVSAAVLEVTGEHSALEDRRRLLKEALTARAHAEGARIRSEVAQRAAEAARARMEFLASATSRMADSMEYETTLQRVAEVAVPTIADWCGITLVEPSGQLRTVAVAHVDEGQTRFAREQGNRFRPRLTDPAGAGRAIRTAELQHIPEITDEMLVAAARDPEHLELLRSLKLRSSLAVPLSTPDGVIGALSVAIADSRRRFTPEDVSLVCDIAARAALQIRNAQLYTERSHIARTLQASLLPRALPEIPGVDVAARYLAAGDQNTVGGDFYDVFPSDAGTWTALIGDVTGKGAEAAAVTALARHTLRTASLRGGRPSEMLRLLNRAMLADGASNRFCTVLYGRLCPSKDGLEVTLSSGGHLPPLLLRSDGSVEPVEISGTLVGGIPDPVFVDRDVRLGTGDLILLYTDGVTELRTIDPLEGERLLVETLRAGAGRTADEVVEAVQQAAVELHDRRPRDDIALLALRVDPARPALG